MLDFLAELKRLANKDNNETFSPATDSLEALRDFFTVGGGGSPGLAYYGVVTAVPGANQFTIPALVGLGAGKFIGTNPYRAFVFRDAGGAAAAPQGEIQNVTAYTTATGVFTTNPFTAGVGIGDEILILHPILADLAVPAINSAANVVERDVIGNKGDTVAGTSLVSLNRVPAADAITNSDIRDGIGNKTDTANEVVGATSSLMRYIKGILTKQTRQLDPMEFWSNPQRIVTIPAIAGTLALPDVTVADLPAGAVVVRAIAMVKFRVVANTNVGANALNGATVAATSQVIQVRDDTPGVWRDAINFVDDQYSLAASTREGGDMIPGSIDIAVEVDGNDTYNFQYLLALADLASLTWEEVQTGLKVWYSI